MVQIGSLQFPDAWIKNKYNQSRKKLPMWDDGSGPAISLPAIAYRTIENANRKSIVRAIDGTIYAPSCSSQHNHSITVSSTSAKVGDIIQVSISCSGGIMFFGYDNYGGKHATTEDKTIDIQIQDKWDKYYLKYAFGFDGAIIDSGEIIVDISVNERLLATEKEITINTCSTNQLQQLSTIIGTVQNVSDTEVSFQAYIKSIEAEFIVDDMSDVAVKSTQGIDIYKVKLIVEQI